MSKQPDTSTVAFTLTLNVDTLKKHVAQHALSTTKPAETHVGNSAMIAFYVGKDTGEVSIESNNLLIGQCSDLHADVDIVSMPSDVVWPFALSYVDLATFLSVCRGDTVAISVAFAEPKRPLEEDEYPSPTKATLRCGTLSINVPAHNPSTMTAVAKTYTSEPTVMSTSDATLIASMLSNFVAGPSDIGLPPYFSGILLQVQPNKVDGGLVFTATATDTRAVARYQRPAGDESTTFQDYIQPALFAALAKAVASELIDGDIEIGKNNHLVVAKSDKLTLCVNTFAADQVADLSPYLDKTYRRAYSQAGISVSPPAQQIAINRDALKQALKAFGLAAKDTKQVFVRWELRQPDADSDGLVLRLSNSNAVNVDVGVEVDARLVSDELSINEDDHFVVEFDYSQLKTAIDNAAGESIVLTNAPFPRPVDKLAYAMIIESEVEASGWAIAVVEFTYTKR